MLNPNDRINNGVFCVYKITNEINGKLYFGITKCSIKKRWKEHKHHGSVGKKTSHLYLAMRKYGVENFAIELVSNCNSEDEMYEIEVLLIKKHKSNMSQYGYNNSSGGEKSSFGKKLTPSQILVISERQKTIKRKPCSQKTKEAMSLAHKGKDMTKQIMASVLARKGLPSKKTIPVSQYTKDGVFVKLHSSQLLAAKHVGGCNTAFSALKNGRLKTYKGYIWKF